MYKVYIRIQKNIQRDIFNNIFVDDLQKNIKNKITLKSKNDLIPNIAQKDKVIEKMDFEVNYENNKQKETKTDRTSNIADNENAVLNMAWDVHSKKTMYKEKALQITKDNNNNIDDEEQILHKMDWEIDLHMDIQTPLNFQEKGTLDNVAEKASMYFFY